MGWPLMSGVFRWFFIVLGMSGAVELIYAFVLQSGDD
jgi:hypothetical protein